MIIDCHGHYTTAPPQLEAFRDKQIAELKEGRRLSPDTMKITDDELRESVETGQIKFQKERGTDLTIFSPRASRMGHHEGDEEANKVWAVMCNDIIYRLCQLYPDNFAGVCQLPQVPGSKPLTNSIRELERSVKELGFVGCNLSPDPSGGDWTEPPLTDKYWYPFYEKMVELDVPAMVHVSAVKNRNFHATGSHYINADTTAFMQFIMSDLFKDFPTLRIIVPHGGGAVPFHWGRYRGLAQDAKRPPLTELMNNVFFDTCVYHFPGIDLLTKVVPLDSLLFGSEMIGAVRTKDPNTGFYFDDTKRYVDQLKHLTDEQRYKLFEGNTRRVFPLLDAALKKRGK